MYKWREKVLDHRKGIGFGHSMVYGLWSNMVLVEELD